MNLVKFKPVWPYNAYTFLELLVIDLKSHAGGVLVVVKNYTGDRINFGIAAERARLGGTDIDTVVVNEDCALESENKMAGRRGLAGTVLVYKVSVFIKI